jgi:hypothetical protein
MGGKRGAGCVGRQARVGGPHRAGSAHAAATTCNGLAHVHACAAPSAVGSRRGMATAGHAPGPVLAQPAGRGLQGRGARAGTGRREGAGIKLTEGVRTSLLAGAAADWGLERVQTQGCLEQLCAWCRPHPPHACMHACMRTRPNTAHPAGLGPLAVGPAASSMEKASGAAVSARGVGVGAGDAGARSGAPGTHSARSGQAAMPGRPAPTERTPKPHRLQDRSPSRRPPWVGAGGRGGAGKTTRPLGASGERNPA